MCGRFTLTAKPETIARSFQLPTVPEVDPRYNIAPTQTVLTVVLENQRTWKSMRWGLVPKWAKDAKIGNKLINARSETAAEKPSFRNAFKRRRCLIVADGFYEWKRTDDRKQPYYFYCGDRVPFAFAGLWETWQPDGQEAIVSCTILTQSANDAVKSVHPRMPVILAPQHYDRWLDPNLTDPEEIAALLSDRFPEKIAAFPVSSAVNNPRHDNIECVSRFAPIQNSEI